MLSRVGAGTSLCTTASTFFSPWLWHEASVILEAAIDWQCHQSAASSQQEMAFHQSRYGIRLNGLRPDEISTNEAKAENEISSASHAKKDQKIRGKMKPRKKNSAALATLLVAFVSGSAVGFVPGRCRSSRVSRLQNQHVTSRHNKYQSKGHPRTMRTLAGRQEISFPSLSYTQNDDATGGNISKLPSLCIDTSCYESQIDTIQSWLSSLTKVERSEPAWLSSSTNEDGISSSDIMSISPSLLIQEHLDAMYTGFHAPVLFPTEADRTKFDFEWRYALLSILPQNDLDQVLTNAQSNSHPLSLYLAAIPPNCCLNLHVHPAIEVFVPLVGSMHERRAMEVVLPKDQLSRSAVMEVGGMGGLFTPQPTPDQINTITKDISSRITFPDLGKGGAFTERSISRGMVELNPTVSVHQSFTIGKDADNDNQTADDGGSLLFIVGSRVFGNFRRKGSFLQRDGIDLLEKIDDILG